MDLTGEVAETGGLGGGGAQAEDGERPGGGEEAAGLGHRCRVGEGGGEPAEVVDLRLDGLLVLVVGAGVAGLVRGGDLAQMAAQRRVAVEARATAKRVTDGWLTPASSASSTLERKGASAARRTMQWAIRRWVGVSRWPSKSFWRRAAVPVSTAEMPASVAVASVPVVSAPAFLFVLAPASASAPESTVTGAPAVRPPLSRGPSPLAPPRAPPAAPPFAPPMPPPLSPSPLIASSSRPGRGPVLSCVDRLYGIPGPLRSSLRAAIRP